MVNRMAMKLAEHTYDANNGLFEEKYGESINSIENRSRENKTENPIKPLIKTQRKTFDVDINFRILLLSMVPLLDKYICDPLSYAKEDLLMVCASFVECEATFMGLHAIFVEGDTICIGSSPSCICLNSFTSINILPIVFTVTEVLKRTRFLLFTITGELLFMEISERTV